MDNQTVTVAVPLMDGEDPFLLARRVMGYARDISAAAADVSEQRPNLPEAAAFLVEIADRVLDVVQVAQAPQQAA